METEFQNVSGKGVGEVLRDISEFLTYPCFINAQKQIDLCTLLPELNMREQLSFALLSEARAQGWEPDAAESFYRHAVAGVLGEEKIREMVAMFRDPEGEIYRAYEKKYGNRFSLLDGSYWATCLALGIDAGQVGDIMRYLRLFTVCLMEFAYMEDRNPDATYTWEYYESFRRMLDELTAEPEPDPLPLKVRAVGGSSARREGDGYVLSLGVDIENPNADRMAREIRIDVTLKDQAGGVIAVIGEKLECIDPGAVYHYGVTRRIKGAAVASISAKARPARYIKLSTSVMKQIAMEGLSIAEEESGRVLKGRLVGKYDRPLRSLTLHYQLLSAENKILGGGAEWMLDGLAAGGEREFSTKLSVPVKGAAKVVYSVDFNVIDLVAEEN